MVLTVSMVDRERRETKEMLDPRELKVYLELQE